MYHGNRTCLIPPMKEKPEFHVMGHLREQSAIEVVGDRTPDLSLASRTLYH